MVGPIVISHNQTLIGMQKNNPNFKSKWNRDCKLLLNHSKVVLLVNEFILNLFLKKEKQYGFPKGFGVQNSS
jgi:hypothetical protein